MKKNPIYQAPLILYALASASTNSSSSGNTTLTKHKAKLALIFQALTEAFIAASGVLRSNQLAIITIPHAFDQATPCFKVTTYETLAKNMARNIARTLQNLPHSEDSSRLARVRKEEIQSLTHTPSYADIIDVPLTERLQTN